MTRWSPRRQRSPGLLTGTGGGAGASSSGSGPSPFSRGGGVCGGRLGPGGVALRVLEDVGEAVKVVDVPAGSVEVAAERGEQLG